MNYCFIAKLKNYILSSSSFGLELLFSYKLKTERLDRTHINKSISYFSMVLALLIYCLGTVHNVRVLYFIKMN